MNRHFLTGAVIVACLCLVTGVSYACVPLGIAIWNTYHYVEVSNDNSNTVSVTADVDYGGPVTTWDWSWSSGLVGTVTQTNDDDSTAEFWSDTAGTYTVDVDAWNSSGSNDDAWAYVKVVEVTSIASGDDVLAVGEEMTFGAITYPLNCHPYVDFTWSAEGGSPSTGSGSLFTTSWNSPGYETVTVYCGDSSAQKNVTVVAVDKVVESGTTDEGPLYVVCSDDTVDLEAKPNPAGASFPTGEPHWSIVSQPTGASASLSPSSGSATTTLSGLTKPGDYVVKAKCADFDTGDTISVTTPPSQGYWEDFMPGFSCPPGSGEPSQVAKPDDCGNRLAIYCDSNNSGNFTAFSWWYRVSGQTGRGTQVGLCVWTGGVNIFDYKVTDATNYGKERYLETRHVTQNNAQGIDDDGEGCNGYWCWRVERYDCVNGAPIAGSPWWLRQTEGAGGSEYQGAPCLGTGGTHPTYPN